MRSQSQEYPSASKVPRIRSQQWATHSRGGRPRRSASSSAGSPKESKPSENSTARPRARRKRAFASAIV